jgi:hypothetical protein
MKLDGGCLCKAIRFRISERPSSSCCCHCRSCQLASGAPYVGWVTISVAEFRVTQGELAICQSSRQARRGSCPNCGSAITYARIDEPDTLDVTIATLDDPAALPPKFHLWVSEKLSWVMLEDGLPQYPEWRV